MPTPATVFLSESNGAGEVVTDNISNINFGGADVPNLVPATHPIVRPNGGVGKNSYNKYLRVKVQALGDSLNLQNFKTWKTSGAYVTGEGLFYDNLLPYATPNDTTNSSAVFPVSEPSPANIQTTAIVAAPTYTSYYRMQTRINDPFPNITPIGAVNQKTIIIQWDES